jgi:DNA-binding transcriptional LysR family regulator
MQVPWRGFSFGNESSGCSYAWIMLFLDMAISVSQWGPLMQLSDRIGRRIKLHDLHVLMAVVQAGSMSKAAALLSTTQPAISRSIAELEHTIGVRLLERNAQGVEPTRYGRALLKRGVAAFDELKRGIQDIEFLSDPNAGELRIAATAALAEGVVAAVIDRLSRQYPRIIFHVVAGDVLAQYAELRERRAELGLVRMSELEPEEDIDQDILFEVEAPFVVVAGADNPWARRRKIELAELVNEPWTWPAPGTAFDSLVIEAFRANGLKPPRATVYADAINLRSRLAANGRFLAVVPAYVMRAPGKNTSLKVLPLTFPTTRRKIGIITLKNRAPSPLAQLFIKCAREMAKPLAKRRSP